MTKSITFKINDVEYTEDEAKELYAFLHKHFGHLERTRPGHTYTVNPDGIALLNTNTTARPIDPEYPKIY